MNKIKDLPESINPENLARLEQAAVCLRDYLAIHRRSNRAHDVLRFIADSTIERIAQGKEAHFSNVAISHAVAGSTDDPSKWLSPIWKQITEKTLPERQDGLMEFARGRGLNFYPWVSKADSGGGAGNQALYRLETRDMPDSEIRITLVDDDTESILYIPELRPQPAWWAKRLFRQEISLQGKRKFFILVVPFIWLIILGAVAISAWLLLSIDRTPLASAHLMLMLLAGGIIYQGRRELVEFEHFIEDRIALAPTYLVGLKEQGVCLEMHKSMDQPSDAPRSIRLVRYAARCPICGSQVLLEKGEPDFPRRLVGRCQESPREHVYSFDRVTRRGAWLRGATLIASNHHATSSGAAGQSIERTKRQRP